MLNKRAGTKDKGSEGTGEAQRRCDTWGPAFISATERPGKKHSANFERGKRTEAL